MIQKHLRVLALTGVVLAGAMAGTALAQGQQPPQVKIPEPGVPQIMTMEGAFVRVAYNNEGYVIIGYRLANNSIGEPWMLLDMGATIRSGNKNQTLTRDAFSLTTPDGKTLPLPSNEEFQKANLAALERRASVTKDSINYFPTGASQGCRIGFFAELSQRARSWDEVELSSTRACLGRLYFPIAGGIQYGQHWLNVKFEGSLIRVPFRILTKDEEKMLNKNYKSIEKQVKEAFAPPKKK
jgi:hypothetical protein